MWSLRMSLRYTREYQIETSIFSEANFGMCINTTVSCTPRDNCDKWRRRARACRGRVHTSTRARVRLNPSPPGHGLICAVSVAALQRHIWRHAALRSLRRQQERQRTEQRGRVAGVAQRVEREADRLQGAR